MGVVAVCSLTFASDGPFRAPAEPVVVSWTHFGGGDWLIRTDEAAKTAKTAVEAVEELSGCEVVDVLISPAETYVMASTSCDPGR
jgi:hypothetical protein